LESLKVTITMAPSKQTFALETFVKRSFNYLSRMVDRNGQPYFNVFWTNPSEAAHDWPDFGDVQSRQLQAAIMARHMTSEEVTTEKVWLKNVLSCIDPETGLFYRPKTKYSEHIADLGDQALTLYALVTAYLDSGDSKLKKTCTKMVDTLLAKQKVGGLRDDPNISLTGFSIKSFMVCARFMNYEPAFEVAKQLVQKVFIEKPIFTPENAFLQNAHVHSTLRTLVGAADYALCVGNRELLDRVDALYRYARSQSTSFGFVPEVHNRKGDVISCETCTLMDYVGLAITLANHGHPEYWGHVERTVRNHLVESQLSDGSWLVSDSAREDTERFTWRDIGERMVGGFAGWSSPTHFLAAKETLNAHWGGPELKNKPRAFQNCCGGSGVHAFFAAWKNASRFQDGTFSVNLHIDKLLPQAEIRCFQPYKGSLMINMKESCKVKVRIPDFVKTEDVGVRLDSREMNFKVLGNYLELGERKAGEVIAISYPLPLTTEQVTIGNPGYRQYHYRVTYKGDTVVKMEPLGNDSATGYSEFDEKEVPVFYGEEGPGRLYQREYMLQDAETELSAIHLDDTSLDFWVMR
jgi:hypothetical protein